LIELEVEIQPDLVPMVAEKLSDFSEPLKFILHDVLQEASLRITTGGPGPSGEPWAPPSKNTRYGPGQTLLLRSGDLLESLSPEGAGNIFEINELSGIVGTEILYASFQQVGTSTIPPRPFLGFSNTELYDKVLEDWIFGESS
jgi:phage gpG-like protein